MEIDVSQMDWALLAQQKESLMHVISDLQQDECDAPTGHGGQRIEHLDGLLMVIDHIQDSAAKQLGEAVIFPHIQED